MTDTLFSAKRSASLLLLTLLAAPAPTQQPTQQPAQQPPAKFTAVQQRGIDFLLAHQVDGKLLQKDQPHLGMSALALAAVLTKPTAARTADEQQFVAAATKFVLSQQNKDGSFGESITNYQTSAATMALSKLDSDAAKAAVKAARDYLLIVQNCEQSEVAPGDKDYGGFGYGPGSRGDLSNTQFAVEALRASGLPANHEAFERAVRFLQRVQNLRSVNDFRTEASEPGSDEKFPVQPGDDGGACYLPGNSKFGFDVIDGGVRVPRSYGSMTYALLKAYTLCGLPGDDARVQAAVRWIGANWTVTENPGADPKLPEKTKYQGLFYYYMLLAQALDAASIEKVEVKGEGGKVQAVDWRQDLRKQVEGMQRKDGSWLNDKNDRWYEGMDILCTCYAMLALEHCK